MPTTVANDDFLQILQGVLDYLTVCFSGVWNFLVSNTWLLALVIAPLLIALIAFGVSLATSLLHKDDGKGER